MVVAMFPSRHAEMMQSSMGELSSVALIEKTGVALAKEAFAGCKRVILGGCAGKALTPATQEKPPPITFANPLGCAAAFAETKSTLDVLDVEGENVPPISEVLQDKLGQATETPESVHETLNALLVPAVTVAEEGEMLQIFPQDNGTDCLHAQTPPSLLQYRTMPLQERCAQLFKESQV